MMRRRLTKPRRGISLPEMLIALIVMGIIGAASVRVLLSQTRYYDVQLKKRSARAASRASVNLLLSELRMMESSAGVEAASATSITLRVPYAMGMVSCNALVGSVVAMLEADSAVLANATPSGYAWRNSSSGAYTYTNASVAMTPTTASSACALFGGTTIVAAPKGREVLMMPRLPLGSQAGDVMFLYQRVRYEFGNSSVLPGRRALFRTIVDSDTREEIAAPFDSDARFRFFQFDRDTSDLTAAVADIRGVELVLNGTSQSPRAGSSVNESMPLRTSVFFNNRN